MNKNILKVTLGACCALFSISVNAQSVGVGTSSPSPNAALEISQGASPQGLLIPKMSGVQMGTLEGGLVSPQDLGMVVYNLDSAAFLYWDGAGFQRFGTSFTLGNTAVTAGTYGSATQIAQFQVDAQGRITAASNITAPTSPWSLSGLDAYYNAGKVGVGTNSPGYTFEVVGTTGLENTDIAGALDVTGGTTSLQDLDVVGSVVLTGAMVFDGTVGWSDAAFATGANGILLAGATGVMSKLDFNGTGTDVLRGDGTWAAVSGDNLGNHTALTNIQLGTNMITGNGGTSGMSISNTGKLLVDSIGVLGSGNVTIDRDLITGGGGATFDGFAEEFVINSQSESWNIGVINDAVSANSHLYISLNAVNDDGTFHIHQSGEIGVGEVVPQERLHVSNGNVRIEDLAYAGRSVALIDPLGNVDTLHFTSVSDVLRGDGTWGAAPSSADNLGDHTATQNIALSGFALSNDGVADGDGLVVDNNGNMAIGGVVNTSYKLYVYGKLKSDGITEMSDRRLKQDISTLTNSLSKIQQLRGVNYNWRKDNEIGVKFEESLQVGLIAQEVEAVFPELVDTDDQGYKSVEYSKLVAVLIEALKEQELKIGALESQVDGLDTLKAEVESLKMEMSKYSLR